MVVAISDADLPLKASLVLLYLKVQECSEAKGSLTIKRSSDVLSDLLQLDHLRWMLIGIDYP